MLEKGFTIFGSIRKLDDVTEIIYSKIKNFIPLAFDVTNEKEIKDTVKIVNQKLNGRNLQMKEMRHFHCLRNLRKDRLINNFQLHK